MDRYPLLDIQDAHRSCDEALDDMAIYVAKLQIDSEGHYPPDGARMMGDIAALRALLDSLLSPAMRKAIAEERKQMDDDAARWEPSSY